MRNESRPIAALLLLLGCIPWSDARGASLSRSTPEAEGISSQAIVDFVEAADKTVDTFDSFMIVRHGKVIAEGWWKPNSSGQPHILNSVSKSFTSMGRRARNRESQIKSRRPRCEVFPRRRSRGPL